MGSKFFDDVTGGIHIDEDAEDRSTLRGYGIGIVNSDDFGSDEEVTEFLSDFRDYLFTGSNKSNRLKCKWDSLYDIDCEAIFDRKTKGITFKNIIVRFDELDYIRINVSDVDITDGTMIV